MSKKRLLLASAVLSMGVLASCGGGGGGTASTPSPQPPPPSATDVAKVLVVFQKGTAGTAGANYTYQVATIRSDGSYTLSPIANDAEIDAKLYSRWTFANGAMLLQDENRNVYFYNPSNNRITPLGIQANGFQPHEFFFAAYGDYVAVRTGTNTFKVVDKTGNVSPVMTTGGIRFVDFTPNFVIARDNTTGRDCVIKASDVRNPECIGTIVDDIDKRILRYSNNNVYLINPDTGDLVDTEITASSLGGSAVNFEGYRFTKVGSDWYFLFKAGDDWYYARLTGATQDNGKIKVEIDSKEYTIADAALDADGKAVVLAYNGDDDRVAVFSNPANTSSYVTTTSDALPDKTFGANARIVYLGKGNGIAKASDGTIVAIVGASVPRIGSIPAGFDPNVDGVILRKDNEMVVASPNYDTDGNDCKYINLANVTNMTANDYIEKNVTDAAFTMRGRTSAGTYVADGNGKFFRVTISNNPCDELKNVTRANTTWIKATVAANTNSPGTHTNFNFFSSKILAHQQAYDTNTCSNDYVNAPQAYLLDLDNDTRTVVGPNMRLGCVNNNVGSTVSLKMPYVYDLNTGAVMYGFNPLFGSRCGNLFDKLVVNIGNTTAEISRDGWCVVTALGIVP